MKRWLVFAGIFALAVYLARRVWVRLVASRYLGISETGQNTGFDAKRFQKQMEKIGWKRGDAWCMYFAKLVWLKTHPLRREELDKLITGNVFSTLKNFEGKSGYEISKRPTIGAIVIFLHGHAGIVSKVHSGAGFEAIEGNTADQVAVRRYTTIENMNFIQIKGII